MNFDRSLIFSYIEEDNIQRAYFRVRPLLSLDGDVQQEALQLWPNEGGLRIVPDRNEQHTFKVRMRQLGSYCVIDLRDQPADAGKIRTNKNYRPDRGEVNQYILYSDTVHELPAHTFYQLLNGNAADYAELAKAAVTPLFYIREEDTLYGPVQRETPAMPEPAQEASGMLFELPCPDGVQRTILCMEDAPVKPAVPSEANPEAQHDETVKPSPAAETVKDNIAEKNPQANEESTPEVLPIGQTLTILDTSKTHEDTLKQLDKPVSSSANLLHKKSDIILEEASRKDIELTGTPLVRTPLHVSAQQTKNLTQEIVTNQWSIGKYVPPAQNLPAGMAMRSVENPVEAACTCLREAWNASGAHDKLTDFMLSLDGLRSQMETKLCNGEHVTVLQRVLRQRLQDLEAERLTALCELDRARRDLDAYKQELISGLSARIARETGALEADRKNAEAQVSALKEELNALLLQRDALLAKVQELQSSVLPEVVAKLTAEAHMSMPAAGVPLRISPISGDDISVDELIARTMDCCAASGVEIDRNTAIALLVMLAVCPRIGISCQTTAAASTLLKNIASAFGWQRSYAHQVSSEQQPLVGMRPMNSTPAILTTSLPNYAPVSEATKLMVNRNTSNLIRNAAYDVSQWPILLVPALPYVEEIDSAVTRPVSAASLEKFIPTSTTDNSELNAVLSPILRAATPLSGSARKEMYRFVSSCAALMDGGLPSAVDWGILLWIIPALERGTKQHAAVKALLDEYPRSLSKL